MMNGAERIALERKRQIAIEKYTSDHDDEHVDGELALAAACYATPVLLYQLEGQDAHVQEISFVDPWPWEQSFDARPYEGNLLLSNDALNLETRIRQLEKAGALIAAEIDRLLRKEQRAKTK